MDGYPMPIADMLVDAAAGHKVISFMDGNAGYTSNTTNPLQFPCTLLFLSAASLFSFQVDQGHLTFELLDLLVSFHFTEYI